MEYDKTLTITREEAAKISEALDAHVFSEDETLTKTVKFDNGYVMDIKCCGTQDGPAYTEAVLYKPSQMFIGKLDRVDDMTGEDFTGEWPLSDEDTGDTYTVTVNEEE